MKKALIYLVLLFLLSCSLIYGYIYANEYIERYQIIEDDSFVVLKEPIIIEVYGDYSFSDLIEINDGELLYDNKFNSQEISNGNVEIMYSNTDGITRKTTISYEIVDTTKPIILAGSSKTVEINSDIDLALSFISGDNYDSNPTREIIGDYDLSKIGDYNLTLKVTDNSNNTASNDFVLHVIDEFPSYEASTKKTYYEDIIEAHKTEDTKVGLDISFWQGEIDAEKLASAGTEFVMLRVGYQAGYGKDNVVDSRFIENIEKLIAADIPVGIYYYSYATSIKEAEDQANWVSEHLKDYDISMPVAFDFESWSDFAGLGLSLYDMNQIGRTFLDTIEDNGYSAMNYSSKYYLLNIWDIDEYPVWLAHYTDQTDYQGDYVMWQLANTGIIDGIYGYVDINILYDTSIIK